MKKYIVVGFPDEKTIEVIPSTWLINKDTCHWPDEKEMCNLKAMIIKCAPPMKTWSKYKIKIYGGSNSFAKASNKSEECRYFSNIDTDSSEDDPANIKKRVPKVPIRYRNVLESEDEGESQTLLGSAINMHNKKKRQPSQMEVTLPKPPSDTLKKLKSIEHVPPVTSQVASEVQETLMLSVNDTERSSVQRQHLEATSTSFLETASTQEEPTLQKILKILIDVKSEVKKLREKVEMKLQVEENPQVAAAISGIVSEDFTNLPLTSFLDLQNLENLITTDPSKATPLARFLCRGGGFNNANALTLLVMKRLLGRSVAMMYSLEGRQEKMRFCDLNLFQVVIASVKMKFQDAETAAISSRIGKVLAGAGDWDGNRIRRKRKEAGEEINKFIL